MAENNKKNILESVGIKSLFFANYIQYVVNNSTILCFQVSRSLWLPVFKRFFLRRTTFCNQRWVFWKFWSGNGTIFISCSMCSTNKLCCTWHGTWSPLVPSECLTHIRPCSPCPTSDSWEPSYFWISSSSNDWLQISSYF